jgi:nitroreductase
MKTKFLALAVVSVLLGSISAADIKFPAPDKKGGMPLHEALSKRQTIRQYQKKALSDKQIGNLLWAAYGVNRANGKFTAPTAANRQEIQIYFLTAKGAYSYCPKTHQAKQITDKDLRGVAGVFKAPCYIVIAADLEKAASRHYAVMDTGYVSQNIYLHCASEGLGTCAIGSFARIKKGQKGKVLRDGLKLPANVEIFLTHSVGIPTVK